MDDSVVGLSRLFHSKRLEASADAGEGSLSGCVDKVPGSLRSKGPPVYLAVPPSFFFSRSSKRGKKGGTSEGPGKGTILDQVLDHPLKRRKKQDQATHWSTRSPCRGCSSRFQASE